MRHEITVAIYDSNRFFSLGVQHILQSYFLVQGLAVNFVSKERYAKADLVVRDEANIEGIYPCRMRQGCQQAWNLVIVVQETFIVRRRTHIPCPSELGSLSRCDSPAALESLVEKMLKTSRQMLSAEATTCKRCGTPLTYRERVVLRGLGWELTPIQLASLLNMSVKTVSTHKRNAMRKLGLKRNSELCHWLRRGGLNDEKGGAGDLD